MKDFKKKFRSDGPGRSSFNANRRPSSDRSFNRPSESFKTNCNKCNNVCEVPFRPNGKKPVYCKDCFVRDDSRDSRDSRGPRSNSFRDNDFRNDSRAPRSESERFSTPRPTVAPADPRIDALQQELRIVHEKLDTLIENLHASAYGSILAESARKNTPEKAAPAKAVAAKKEEPKKKGTPTKTAKSAPAKKTVLKRELKKAQAPAPAKAPVKKKTSKK